MKKNVTFYSPGTMFAESNTLEIEGKDLNDILGKAVIESKKIIIMIHI